MPVDSARRGVTYLQIVLALVFLAIIGGSGGYLAAHRQRQHDATAAALARAGSSPVAETPPSPPAPGTVPASPSPGTSASPSPSPSGTECLAHTEQLAGTTPLFQVLYLRTPYSEVWICRSVDGVLFYQGHRGPPHEPLVEGTNALFLTRVEENPDVPGGYVATNVDDKGSTTRYLVSATGLVLETDGVAASPEPAVTSVPG